MRYTLIMFNSDNQSPAKRRGAPIGNTNSVEHGRPPKDKETGPRSAFIGVRVPQATKDALSDHGGSEADAIIDAVRIAQAHGWRKPE